MIEGVDMVVQVCGDSNVQLKMIGPSEEAYNLSRDHKHDLEGRVNGSLKSLQGAIGIGMSKPATSRFYSRNNVQVFKKPIGTTAFRRRAHPHNLNLLLSEI
ncbi:hypothetical protein NC651_017503 [Populus alba x Populus x berolinensis]|nr:hypothetical protein NC651_017503 [Populus alba x Populus x berolinensis]